MIRHKFPTQLFLWIFKKYIWISISYFMLSSAALISLAYFTQFVSTDLLIPIIIALFLFSTGSIIVFLLVLFLSLKPLSYSIQKIELLAQHSSNESIPQHITKDLDEFQNLDDAVPDEIYTLNQNLDLIYSNLITKTLNLAKEQEELKAITAAVSDAIIAVDSDQKIIFANPQAKKWFLTQNLPDRLLYLSEVIRVNDVLDNCNKCIKYGTAFSFERMINSGEHQQPRLFEVNISTLKNPLKEVEGAVLVFFDKTEIKNTEKSQSDFVSNVSHELKTPLTVVKGFIETMVTDLEEKNYAQMHHFLNIVSRNVKRLIDLVDDLLALSHIDSESNLNIELIDTKEVTAIVCESINTEEHELVFTFNANTVSASRRWVEQLLYNLVTNAVKYTPKGSTIDVIWEKHPHFILLTVKDNGEGIPIQHQARIFERFYRVDEDRSREKGGTGIGLAIVKQVMDKHGGQVYVSSRRRGKGAKFTCAFPR